MFYADPCRIKINISKLPIAQVSILIFNVTINFILQKKCIQSCEIQITNQIAKFKIFNTSNSNRQNMFSTNNIIIWIWFSNNYVCFQFTPRQKQKLTNQSAWQHDLSKKISSCFKINMVFIFHNFYMPFDIFHTVAPFYFPYQQNFVHVLIFPYSTFITLQFSQVTNWISAPH